MLSVVIPALNEERMIQETIEVIKSSLTKSSIEYEIIVVNDGSKDNTGEIAESCDVTVIHHPKPGGYGRALKDGILKAKYDIIAITDADGTYPNERIPDLYNLITVDGYDMAIGARQGRAYQGTFIKMPMRRIFIWLSEYATGQKIADINSGLRVFKKEIPLRFWHTISNGFSFTTTITLASLLNGYFLKYTPIDYHYRVGSSHVKYWRDSIRSLQIIVESILYYNPLKLFLLLMNCLLAVSGVSLFILLFAQSNSTHNFFSNLAIFSFVNSFLVAAIGLAATLKKKENDHAALLNAK